MDGWISYRCSDKSGCSWNKIQIIYAPGWSHSDSEDIKEMILDAYESWTRYADYYRFEIVQIGCTPPVEMIEKEIKEIDERLASLIRSKKQLELQLLFRKTE